MNQQDDGGRPERKMFEGDWKCSECGTAIKQLPFQPGEGQSVTCKECYMKTRGSSGPRERKTFKGNWQCADCGDAITELPFEPSGGRPLYCRNCFKKSR